MKLFGHDTSPYVRRARVLLAEKGLPFDRDDAGWVKPSEAFARLSPVMRVPALLDGDQAVFDSGLIATYLYERFPGAPPPPPAGHVPLQATLFDPATRYDDENALLVIDGALSSAINLFLLEQDGVPRSASAYMRRQSERIARCVGFVDDLLGERSTLHEGVFSFTDITLGCALDWFTFRQRYDVARHRNLTRFQATHRERPSMASTHPEKAAAAPAPRAGG